MAERWAEEARRSGLVDRLELLPAVTFGDVPGEARSLRSLVLGEARVAGVDGVVLVARSRRVRDISNLLQLLDLTLIGAMVIPAHSFEIRTVTEVVVLDARTGRQYGSGYAELEETIDSPVAGMYVAVERRKEGQQLETLREALLDLFGNLELADRAPRLGEGA